jgi:hypothetical protein
VNEEALRALVSRMVKDEVYKIVKDEVNKALDEWRNNMGRRRPPQQ